MEPIEYTVFNSSIGSVLLMAQAGKIIRLDVSRKSPGELKKAISARYPHTRESAEMFQRPIQLLDRYLRGERVDFDVEVDISDLRPFTRRVLTETMQIPYGEVSSYVRIARKLGYLNAARAVGQALKRNPVPIIIPCHRVTREDGSLGGFSLEGITKERLLRLEGYLKVGDGAEAEELRS